MLKQERGYLGAPLLPCHRCDDCMRGTFLSIMNDYSFIVQE